MPRLILPKKDAELLKAQVEGYYRSDGTYVKPHDNGRQAAAPEQPKGDHHAAIAKLGPKGKAYMQRHMEGEAEIAKQLGTVSPKHQAHFDKMREAAIAHASTLDAPSGDEGRPAGGSAKPHTPDDVKQHAVSAGAKFRTNVSVFSKPELAHSFAEKTKGQKGGAVVMSHPDHDHHVVVSGADAQRMEKNGYQIAKPGATAKPAESGDPYGHPNVVGKATKMVNYRWSKETGTQEVPHDGKPTDASEIEFLGKRYSSTNKDGESLHDGTRVRMFKEDDGTDEGGHRVWLDDQGRVHADHTGEVKDLRAEYEAHAKKSAAKPAAKKAAPKA